MINKRTNAAACVALAVLLAGGASAHAAAAVNLHDECAMCHEKAPVSAAHVPVAKVTLKVCRECHTAIGDKSMFRAVHGKHLDMGMHCASCHTLPVPERSTLDAALKAAAGSTGS